MADLGSNFEGSDLTGSTDHFSGSVGTSMISVPASPGNAIAEVLVRNSDENNNLLVSFDSGSNFFTLLPLDAMLWSLKGNKTEIEIKGSAAGVGYEIIMNRESI